MKRFVGIVCVIMMALAVAGIAIADSIQGIAVDGSGNVGVGTNAPFRQFEVYDDGSVGQAIIGIKSQSDDLSGIFFASTADSNIGGIRYFHAGNSTWQDLMGFRVNDEERMVIDRDGNVGINTTTPSGRLDVKGTYYISGNSGSSKMVGVASDASENWFYVGSGGLMFRRQDDWVNLGHISPTGNFGINTTYQFGGGAGVLSISDAATVPTSTPAGAALFYCQSGQMYVRDADDNGTPISPPSP